MNKTYVFDGTIVKSDEYIRRVTRKFRGAFLLAASQSVNESELSIACNGGNIVLGAITQFFFIITDGDNISLNVTQETTTINIKVAELAILSGPITSLEILNSDPVDSDPTIVDVIYS